MVTRMDTATLIYESLAGSPEDMKNNHQYSFLIHAVFPGTISVKFLKAVKYIIRNSLYRVAFVLETRSKSVGIMAGKWVAKL